MPRFNQYIKKVEHNGIVFDSKEELDYYLFLTRQQETASEKKTSNLAKALRELDI